VSLGGKRRVMNAVPSKQRGPEWAPSYFLDRSTTAAHEPMYMDGSPRATDIVQSFDAFNDRGERQDLTPAPLERLEAELHVWPHAGEGGFRFTVPPKKGLQLQSAAR